MTNSADALHDTIPVVPPVHSHNAAGHNRLAAPLARARSLPAGNILGDSIGTSVLRKSKSMPLLTAFHERPVNQLGSLQPHNDKPTATGGDNRSDTLVYSWVISEDESERQLDILVEHMFAYANPDNQLRSLQPHNDTPTATATGIDNQSDTSPYYWAARADESERKLDIIVEQVRAYATNERHDELATTGITQDEALESLNGEYQHETEQLRRHLWQLTKSRRESGFLHDESDYSDREEQRDRKMHRSRTVVAYAKAQAHLHKVANEAGPSKGPLARRQAYSSRQILHKTEYLRRKLHDIDAYDQTFARLEIDGARPQSPGDAQPISRALFDDFQLILEQLRRHSLR